LNLAKNDNNATREIIHHKQISPPKSRQGGRQLFRFNVHEELWAMNLKPLYNLVCRNPMVDNVKARCTHVRDQFMLSNEVHDEANHY
jgi:hypothetical protein